MVLDQAELDQVLDEVVAQCPAQTALVLDDLAAFERTSADLADQGIDLEPELAATLGAAPARRAELEALARLSARQQALTGWLDEVVAEVEIRLRSRWQPLGLRARVVARRLVGLRALVARMLGPPDTPSEEPRAIRPLPPSPPTSSQVPAAP